MKDTQTQETSEFFWKRLTEPFPLSHSEEFNASLWLLVLFGVLSLALVYVLIMYIRDSRRVGLWAVLLGGLRLGVYALLAVMFLLPARRHISQSVDQARVLVLFDTSASMETSRDDNPAPGQRVSELPTRQDKVVAFLADKHAVLDDKDEVKSDFFEELQKRNPVTAYRFHSELDKPTFHFTDGRVLTGAEVLEYQRNPAADLPTRTRLEADLLEAWLKPMSHALRINDLAQREEQSRTALGALRVANGDLMVPGQELVYGTDLAGAVDALFEEEANHRLQGVVIFTDGRSTRRSIDKFDRVRERAARLRVPIFVVGVGAFHQKVQITPNPLGVPERIQPDTPFQVVVQAIGEGLAGEKVDVTLEVRHVRKVKENEYEELDIVLEEDKGPKLGGRLDDKQPGDKPKEDPKDPGKDPGDKKSDLPRRVALGKLLRFKPRDPVTGLPRIPTFSKETPPQLVVPFDLTPQEFIEAVTDPKVKKDLEGRRWVLAPTEPDTELQFRAIIGRHPRELAEETEHLTRPQGMKVIKKPLRVLLFAGGSSQEYRFVQRVMAQEMDKGLVEVAFYVQKTLKREELIIAHKQDPMRRRTLITFPTKYKKQGPDLPKSDVDEATGFGVELTTEDGGKRVESEEAKLYDLDNYDVILAFDADWAKLDEQQIRNVIDWVEGKKDREKGGGGLVLIAGPVNTARLSRRKTINPEFVDLLPVVPRDLVLETSRIDTNPAWRLDFQGATPDLEFLRLAEGDEPGAQGAFLDDWREFFGPVPDAGPNVSQNLATRGMHMVYPVQEVRDGTVLVPARFTDDRVRAMIDGKKQPFMAMWPAANEKRVIWIGAGELWRLRTFSGPTGEGVGVRFYERFWAKLIRYAGAKRLTASGKRLNLVRYGDTKVNGKVTVVGDYANPDGTPLPPDARMRIRLTLPPDPQDAGNAGPRANERTVVMEPLPPRPGRFRATFPLPRAGTYKLVAEIEDTRSEPSEFTIDAYNPEIENTQPDFDDMWYLASPTDLVMARITDDNVRRKLQEKLKRPKLEGTIKIDSRGEPVKEDDKPRLFFTLDNAELIPLCMVSDPNTTTTQGSVDDLWDWGVQFPSSSGRPWKLSYALLAASLLLSAEWLIRKLLRLA